MLKEELNFYFFSSSLKPPQYQKYIHSFRSIAFVCFLWILAISKRATKIQIETCRDV